MTEQPSPSRGSTRVTRARKALGDEPTCPVSGHRCIDGRAVRAMREPPSLSRDVLEAVPAWGEALLARIEALEPRYERCPDCQQLLARVEALEQRQMLHSVEIEELEDLLTSHKHEPLPWGELD